jgi:Leucyl-tRNA synthetase
MRTFDHQAIEKKWQKKWKDAELYRTQDHVDGKENEYVLVEFPCPSGNLHVGHWYAFAVPDIYARMRRMQGKNVLYPIGFDAFGLPAENAAIKRGLDPREWTEGNMQTMAQQLESMGNSFDWSRLIRTCDPAYYKWTQWLFLQLYKKGLAYKKKSTVPWCDSCKTVLANEQIVHGACERCGAEVVQKELDQWFFKITAYAERLLQDLEQLDWPEEIKQAQREWIGKSEGANIRFK